VRRSLPAALRIRSAEAEDAARLADLFSQLGYAATREWLGERLAALATDPRAAVLVAAAGDQVIGAATLAFVPVAHEFGPWCRVTAIVVDEADRGRGIGEALIEAAEEAARAAGCVRIEATSATHRTDAHRFYERLGYGQTSAHYLMRLDTE
jgi:GNAT superfamily N-acetyltransferase